jgi:hypothetical protein
MAKIKLVESTGGAYINQAGSKVLLRITKSNYDQDFGKVEITLENEKGELVNNNFGLMSQDGSMNEGAIKAFSYFARVAIGDWGRDDIEDEELVGCYVRADIKMVKGSKPNKDGEILEYANLDKVYMTDDTFDDQKTLEVSKPKAKPQVQVSEPDESDDDWE